jgi:hypothetical protein
MDLSRILAAIPAVATGWPGVVAVLVVTSAWIVVSRKVSRNKQLLQHLEKLPPKDRADVLRAEMGDVYLQKGMTEKGYLQNRTNTLLLVAFLAMLVAFCFVFAVTVFALTRPAAARSWAINVPPDVDGSEMADPSPAVARACSYVMFTVKDYGPARVEFRLDGRVQSATVAANTPLGDGLDGIAVLKDYDRSRDVPIGVGGSFGGGSPYAKDDSFRPGQGRYFAVGTRGHLEDRSYAAIVDESSASALRTFAGNHGISLQGCEAYGSGVTFVMPPGPKAGTPVAQVDDAYPLGKVSILSASYGVPGALCDNKILMEQLKNNIRAHQGVFLDISVDDAPLCPGQNLSTVGGAKGLYVSWTCGNGATPGETWRVGNQARITCKDAKP